MKAYKITGKLGDICSFVGGNEVKKGDTVYLQPQRKWVGTVDCIGLALDLEAQAKRVESQTVERALLAAANGLRIIDKESKA